MCNYEAIEASFVKSKNAAYYDRDGSLTLNKQNNKFINNTKFDNFC